jgi:hypothetical protein
MLESLIEGDKEENVWIAAEQGLRDLDERIRGIKGGKRFLFGEAVPSWTDFTVGGALESARVIHAGTFERLRRWEGLMGVYGSVREWMDVRD